LGNVADRQAVYRLEAIRLRDARPERENVRGHGAEIDYNAIMRTNLLSRLLHRKQAGEAT
jgi:hypothetical protein